MPITNSRAAKVVVLAGSMTLTLFVGCSGNQNEQEFLNSAPPGKASEFPDEGIAQRKARTLRPSKAEKEPTSKTPPAAKSP
jgi:hypothetical protein